MKKSSLLNEMELNHETRIQILLNQCSMAFPPHTRYHSHSMLFIRSAPEDTHCFMKREQDPFWSQDTLHGFSDKGVSVPTLTLCMLNGSLATQAKVCLASPQHRHDGSVLKQGQLQIQLAEQEHKRTHTEMSTRRVMINSFINRDYNRIKDKKNMTNITIINQHHQR